jgi:hypothetical protein
VRILHESPYRITDSTCVPNVSTRPAPAARNYIHFTNPLSAISHISVALMYVYCRQKAVVSKLPNYRQQHRNDRSSIAFSIHHTAKHFK